MGRTTGVLLCLVILLSVGSFIAAAEDTDSDGDGWIDSFEEACKTNPYDSQSIPKDSDSSGICDTLDIDDDNDGWIDRLENYCGTDPVDKSSVPNDLDNDGVCDSLDKDTDNDSWSDFDELLCQTSPIDNSSYPMDLDQDGDCDLLIINLPIGHEPVQDNVFLGNDEIQILALSSVLIISTGTVYTIEPVRWAVSRKAWLSLLLMAGIVKKTQHGEFQRGRLYGFIESNPGIHLSALTRLSNLGNNQATYHLDILEKEGIIWSRKEGRLLVFFADTVSKKSEIISPLLDINFSKNSIKKSILMYLNQAELMNLTGPNGSELAKEIGVSSQVLSYHIRSLINWEMVERKRTGMRSSLYITELGIEALTKDVDEMNNDD
jgi:DNA-binding MarR family transcriptional regulator|tara:strand:+ start:197 stop:1327 length:1131 start_codon:yes stop_codon:yes gene_type:complete